MAAVANLALTVLAVWTLVAFVVAIAVGKTLRRLEPVPARVKARHPRVVDLRSARSR